MIILILKIQENCRINFLMSHKYETAVIDQVLLAVVRDTTKRTPGNVGTEYF